MDKLSIEDLGEAALEDYLSELELEELEEPERPDCACCWGCVCEDCC